MRSRPVTIASLAATAALLILGAAPPGGPVPLPARMADTGGGSQLVTAQAARTGSTTGTVTWWDRRDGRWVATGSAAARFGSKGLTDGASRKQGTYTTPTGLYGLPYAFGIESAPAGTTTAYRRVHQASWWCQDNDSQSYNRWTEPRPADCRATESEHLVSYATQYAHAFVIAYNYDRPVRGRGAGIFLHVNGRGATAGCVSVPADAMRRILRWAEPGRRPHIAIGTDAGATAITRY
ncbi:L,D-transpeptidase family protein [Streptomyces sp. NPDC048425]|uniref:L,D-transpeptidase family protein n=1 Tax=Streptomyces sp. NPDC048425 TaxID=3365548 RepID=UPI00372413FA